MNNNTKQKELMYWDLPDTKPELGGYEINWVVVASMKYQLLLEHYNELVDVVNNLTGEIIETEDLYEVVTGVFIDKNLIKGISDYEEVERSSLGGYTPQGFSIDVRAEGVLYEIVFNLSSEREHEGLIEEMEKFRLGGL